jgi:hypothetical protein
LEILNLANFKFESLYVGKFDEYFLTPRLILHEIKEQSNDLQFLLKPELLSKIKEKITPNKIKKK